MLCTDWQAYPSKPDGYQLQIYGPGKQCARDKYYADGVQHRLNFTRKC